MAGWLLTNAPEGADAVCRRLRAVFEVEGVPPLHAEARPLAGGFHTVLWTWGPAPVPDVHVAVDTERGRAVVLCGAVTSLGRYGPVAGDTARSILDLYGEHGTAMLPEVNGSFSLAFADARTQAASLFTDRFASRSVWHRGGDVEITAGNFPSAIAAARGEAPALDPAGLWSLFAIGRHAGRRGLYRGVHNLQAGERAELQAGGGTRVTTWHALRYRPERGRSVREWGRSIASAMAASADRLAAITPSPYLFLSGGLDSRLAAGALGGRTRTATLTSSANMNARVARKVAARTGAAHETIARDPHWYRQTFDAAALAASGNYNIKHAHFMGGVRHITARDPGAAFLLGDLLENFNKHYFKFVPPEGFEPARIPEHLSALYSYGHRDPAALARLFRRDVATNMRDAWRAEFVALCDRVRDVSDDPRDCLDALFRWYNCSLCPTYIMLECITPLAAERNLMFDNGLHALYTSVPSEVRGSERTHPWTLWHLDPWLALMPDANAWQPPLAPTAFKHAARALRPRIGRLRRGLMSWRHQRPSTRTEGSWQMMHVWFRTDAQYRALIEGCLFDERCLPSEIFDRRAIEHLWREFLSSDAPDTYEIEALLSFGLLQRRLPAAPPRA